MSWLADPYRQLALLALAGIVVHLWWVAGGGAWLRRQRARRLHRLGAAERRQRQAMAALERAHWRAEARRGRATGRPNQ